MRCWLDVFAELYDPAVCNNWCYKFFAVPGSQPFGSLEEHEAWHVQWIQAMVTFDEWVEHRQKVCVQ